LAVVGGCGSGDDITVVGAVRGDDWPEISDVDLVISELKTALAASAIRLALIASLWERSSASAMFAGSTTLLDGCWIRFGRSSSGADGADWAAFAIDVDRNREAVRTQGSSVERGRTR
jgi:hypothetical protein